MPYFACSAKDNINLKEAFDKIVDMAYENNKKGEENYVDVPNVKIIPEPKKKKKCC